MGFAVHFTTHTHTTQDAPHTTHTHTSTGTWVDTRRRRHRRVFRDYSAHRFRRVFHHTQHKTHHTHTHTHTHTSQVLGWAPGDECTNDYFAITRPIGFAVFSTIPNTRHHTPHTHHRYLAGHQATKAPTTISRLLGPSVSPCISPHTTQDTPHTTHTHITGTWVGTRRRRHQRLFCDYSALRFAVHFGSPSDHTSQHIGPNIDTPLSTRSHHPPTPHMQHETHHTPHISQVFGWTPGDEGTNDYSATILPYVSPCISGRQPITHHNT